MPWTVEVARWTGSYDPVTAPDIAGSKGGDPLVMVTAYDAPSARAVDAAGVDMILVGDSVAMVVLGYDDTLHVTVDDMAHHTAAVARTKPHALVVADLPWMSYHLSRDDTVRNAAQLVRAGAGAVKLEGGRKRVDAVHAILDAEIPVMGHIGLTPQSVHSLGGFKLQGKTLDAARDRRRRGGARRGRLLRDRARVRARRSGAHGDRLDRGADHRHRRGSALRRPGARVPRHPRLRGPRAPALRAALRHLLDDATTAIGRFAADVRDGSFPASAETYHAPESVTDAIALYGSGPRSTVTA